MTDLRETRAHLAAPRRAWTGILASLVSVLVALAGCASSTSDTGDAASDTESTGDGGNTDDPTSLVDWLAWQEADPLVDPWAEFRPDAVDCGLSGWFPEGEDSIEVNTAKCSYATLVTPAVATAKAGDELELWFWHYQLTAPEPAIGFAGLEIDGTRIWDYQVAIPGDAFFVEERFALERDVEIGDPIYIHVRNHGQNSWTYQRIAVVPQ